MCVKGIASQTWDFFLRHSVYLCCHKICVITSHTITVALLSTLSGCSCSLTVLCC